MEETGENVPNGSKHMSILQILVVKVSLTVPLLV